MAVTGKPDEASPLLFVENQLLFLHVDLPVPEFVEQTDTTEECCLLNDGRDNVVNSIISDLDVIQFYNACYHLLVVSKAEGLLTNVVQIRNIE